MYHCGIDLHSKVAVYHLLDGAGQTLARGSIEATETELGSMARSIARHTRFYVEASTSSAWFARLIEACGHQVMVVDPNRLRAISSSPKKTDAHDAEVLVSLGKAGLLTAVHMQSEETDRFHCLFTAACSRRDTLGYVQAPASSARPVPSCAAKATTCPVATGATSRGVSQKPTGLPSVGRLIATSFPALVEDPRRFRSSSEVTAYLGLAPWVNSSAGKRKPGGITKRGNRATRALLVQGAWAHVRSSKDTALKRWYYKLAERVGKKKAIVALARKLGELLWTLWRKQVDYQAFPPSSRRAPAPT